MTLHLMKLGVGAKSVEDMAEWQRTFTTRWQGRRYPCTTTRFAPKRVADVIAGGSLYWIIQGKFRLRQRILDFVPTNDENGVERQIIILDPCLYRTQALPQRPFQGWRYLTPAKAPRDIGLFGAEDTSSGDLDLEALLKQAGILQ